MDADDDVIERVGIDEATLGIDGAGEDGGDGDVERGGAVAGEDPFRAGEGGDDLLGGEGEGEGEGEEKEFVAHGRFSELPTGLS